MDNSEPFTVKFKWHKQKIVMLGNDGDHFIDYLVCPVIYKKHGCFIHYHRSIFNGQGTKFILKHYDAEKDIVFYKEVRHDPWDKHGHDFKEGKQP